MNCRGCKTINNADAYLCAGCGRPLEEPQPEEERKRRRAYFAILLFVPIIAVAAAIGYHKFILPNGVAAVVNSEDIRVCELESAIDRKGGKHNPDSASVRLQVLDELISERLVLQEAAKVNVRVSQAEIAAAVEAEHKESGLDSDAFKSSMSLRYDSIPEYEKEVAHHLIMSRLIAQKIAPPGADPVTARRTVARWLEGIWEKASVRITLSEELSQAGCGRGTKACEHVMRESECGSDTGSMIAGSAR